MSGIEYFYSAHSAFAYLGSRRFMGIAAAAGRKIVQRPYYLNRAIAGVGSVPDPLLTAAETPEINAVYEANTDEAIERSVFGSPTYFVDGDMFYGQDHLELVERALQRPYKPSNYRLIGAETR